ncbi:RNA-guided endonuclease InsQ/TnpB family protein [Streptomyces agglomeratus]|uniref:RNA-guided endonuclease InsQ/TnpB family protein n=1 Tax=Streptomyces agglomeratus TaxID=285458 RepID=UPI000A6C11ED
MVIVQLRYSFRVYPSAGQRLALGRAFGCVRVVFNDALRVREAARCAGLPFVAFGELSRQLTVAKKTPERAWLAEVSSVVLQQSLRDLDIAYRNFFDGLKGKRPRMGAPGFKSRKDTRQAIRFTANAGWKVTAGGKLRLPKVGDLAVKWSRSLPSAPSTVTVIKDSAGRYSHRSWSRPNPGHCRIPAARSASTGARVRPGPVTAQREETGTHPKPQPVTTGRQTGNSAP